MVKAKKENILPVASPKEHNWDDLDFRPVEGYLNSSPTLELYQIINSVFLATINFSGDLLQKHSEPTVSLSK